MGMYDVINSEQVKAFPWAHFYKDKILNTLICYSGGNLNNYNTGDTVPYKNFYYNYGKNFMILDINIIPDSDYADYDFILHVIRDGKVKSTYKDKIGKEDFSLNNCVISKRGRYLNIKCEKDIYDYISDMRKYNKERDTIRSKWNEMFSESSKYIFGLGLIDRNSDEYAFRHKKLKELSEAMKKEEERTKKDEEELSKRLLDKWGVDTEKEDRLAFLGEFLYIIKEFIKNNKIDGEEIIISSNMLTQCIEQNPGIVEEYSKWQELNDNEKNLVNDIIEYANSKKDYSFTENS